MKIGKASKLIILIILAIMMSLVFIKSSYAEIDYSHSWGYIYNFDYDEGSTKVKLETGSTVYLFNKETKATGTIGGKDLISTLQQPNIYCLERGRKLNEGNFKVSKEYTVKDPVLAYILYNGPSYDVLEGGTSEANNYKNEDSQKALWNYIKDGRNDNGQLSSFKLTSETNGTTSKYTDAINYASNMSLDIEITSAYYDANDNKIKGTVKTTGNFKEYDLKVGNNTVVSNRSNKSFEIDATGYNGDVKIEVDARGKEYDKYTVKYRILSKSGQQKVLVVTYKDKIGVTPTDTASKPVNIQSKTNVSLQKYIIEAGATSYSNRDDRKATNNTTNQISKNIKNSSGTNKNNDVVYIEPGEWVYYRISVYNNSDVEAKEIKIKDTLPKGVTKYKVKNYNGSYGNEITINSNNREYVHTIKELSANDVTNFEIGAYFGEYVSGTLENKAQIQSVSPKNNTTYRTVDSDYVEMKKYKVSLEKFVYQVIGKNNTSASVTENNSNLYAYYSDVISYLKEHTTNATNLIGKWITGRNDFDNETTIKDVIRRHDSNGDGVLDVHDQDVTKIIESYDSNDDGVLDSTDSIIIKKYDLNSDGKIDQKDVNIFNNWNQSSSYITNYTKADINGDGHINNSDLNIYKIIKADLNQDGYLDNNDRYMFILKSMYANENDYSKALQYLYLKRLLLKEENNKENIKNKIDNYIKSDVNGDGYVDLYDNYKIHEDLELQIQNGEDGYRINEDAAIKGAQNLWNIKNDIQVLDINNDNILNNADVVLLEEYKNNSDYINQLDRQTVASMKSTLESIRIEFNSKGAFIRAIDSNGNDKLDVGDKGITESLIAKYDFNKDNVIDENDVDIVAIIQEYDTNEDGILDENDNDITSIMEQYDTNEDNIIDESDDITSFIEQYDLEIDSFIDIKDYLFAKKICDDYNMTSTGESNLENWNIADFRDTIFKMIIKEVPKYERYDFNKDGKLDDTDYNVLSTYIEIFRCYDADDILLNKDAEESFNTIINGYYITDYETVNAYNMNGDDRLDFKDYILAKYERTDLLDEIKKVLSFSVFIDCDYCDSVIKSRKSEINNNIDNIKNCINTLIKNYSVFDIDSNNKDLSQEDLNVIQVYKGWKEYDYEYDIENFDYTLYDVNNDGILNNDDKSFIDKDYGYIDTNLNKILNVDEIDLFVEFFINKQETYNSDTLNAIQLDDIVNTYENLKEIIESMSAQEDVSTILANEEYRRKVSGISSIREIEEQINNNNLNIDINHDGQIDEGDQAYIDALEHFKNGTIISTYDMNEDGEVNETDILFYNQLKEINSKNIETAIDNAAKEESGTTDGTSGGTSTDSNGEIEDTYGNSRAGHRNNEFISTNDANNVNKNHDSYKAKNQIAVEPGDKIIYTIRLKNEGDNPIKVRRIYDTFLSRDNINGIDYKGTKLVLDEAYGIKLVNNDGSTTSGYGKVIDRNYGSASSVHERYLIQFEYPIQIDSGSHIDIRIKFKLEVPAEYTNIEIGKIKKDNGIQQVKEGDKDYYKQNYEYNGIYMINKSGIVQIWNKKDITVSDYDDSTDTTDGREDNYDMDWLKLKTYKVSLQKIVHKVYNTSTSKFINDTNDSSNNRWNHWESIKYNGANQTPYYNPMKEGTDKTDKTKYFNPVTAEKGDTIVYAIKVRNDGNIKVKNIKVEDTLPEQGLDLARNKISIIGIATAKGNYYDTGENIANYVKDINRNSNSNICKFTLAEELDQGEETTVYISATVTEPNMSINIRQNSAKIVDYMKNRNDADIKDSTQDDNSDSDYFQTRDIVLEGNVWNDRAFDKTTNNYNAIFDGSDKEPGIGKIIVKLYRVGTSGSVATTRTDADGNYSFSNEMLSDKATNGIKASKTSGTQSRWSSYHQYYIVFEYDGVKYTSTSITTKGITTCVNVSGNIDKNNTYQIDSNAREDNNTDKNIGVVTRAEFNNRFNPINTSSDIKYNTKNEDGYIPQSIYNGYNGEELIDKFKMQSSTNVIKIGDIAGLDITDEKKEDVLKNIDLGLRGRDIFDLELTSDVDNVKVTVNNVQGVYKYTNRVQLRATDINPTDNIIEDAANTKQEKVNSYVDVDEDTTENTQKQNIRTSDIYPEQSGYNEKQGISNIEVTYKITVKNVSKTAGTATKITNYYDSRYSLNSDKNKIAYYYKNEEAKNNDNKSWIIESNINGISKGSHFGHVEITTPETWLNQNCEMEIYVVYTLDNTASILGNITGGNPLPTYNMAEITEYETKCAEGQTEYTRGLMDKDSEPGSAHREKVRLIDNQSADISNKKYESQTTVEYYFLNTGDLGKLKYEDDTYATPTLYFVANESKRKITGTVFEDYTSIIKDGTEEVKTGNGWQDKEDNINIEPGVKGVVVTLYEVGNKRAITYAVTDSNGEFELNGFLPGNYIIEYQYGIESTGGFLVDNNPNTKSYNGEDFQSTNNTGKIGGNSNSELRELNNTPEFWYSYNEDEGISTAIDDSERRKIVSENLVGFTVYQMSVLNNVRDGMKAEDAKVKDNTGAEITTESISEATEMIARTPVMKLTMEETFVKETTGEDGKIKKTLVEHTTFPGTTNESGELINGYEEYNVSNMNFGIAEVPVTIVDLQKHVHSFKIKDSKGSKVLASLERDSSKTAVVVNPSKMSKNRVNIVTKILDEYLEGDIYTKEYLEQQIDWDNKKDINENINIKTGLNNEEIDKVRAAITKYSLAREVKIVPAWKVNAGNIIAPPGTNVIDVSLEDDNLQGSELEITYIVTASIHAEKNFNNDSVTVATIEGIIDYVDNNVFYDSTSKTVSGKGDNIAFWESVEPSKIKFGEGDMERESGTIDPDGTKYTTTLALKSGNGILRPYNDTTAPKEAYITVEKVLAANDLTIQDILTNNVDIYEYQNSVEITNLGYSNQQDTDEFIFKDRVRTADRYIILPGIQHDSATSEIISIHPPTGDNSISMVYLVIAVISLTVIAGGIFAIKKFIIKK